MRVFVLLFNAGTDNEGIHTISLQDRDIVLMFEDEDDAIRYALLLEAQDFPTPSVEALDQSEIEEFCNEAGYACRLIPRNFVPQNEFERLLLAPPERNLEELSWDTEEAPSATADREDEPEEMSRAELEAMRRRLEGLL